jgi:2-polyprenyl-3-methyl-5-hydroxy-6-metoxy-1,4-benzoquinol methylase
MNYTKLGVEPIFFKYYYLTKRGLSVKMKCSNDIFYSSLVKGKVKRGITGIESRFSYNHVMNNPSVKKYLLPFLDRQINCSDVVLDYGSGSGILLPLISTRCKEVHGFDVVPAFVELAKDLLKTTCVKNAFVYNDNEFKYKFIENCFDVIIINDVLHHMENPLDAISDAYRLLKPNGKLIIIEPNRFNLGIFILCACDQNERKLLKMGYFEYYTKIILLVGGGGFEIIEKDWFPLIYGPSSKLVRIIAEICNRFPFRLLRWCNPKLYLICKIINK